MRILIVGGTGLIGAHAALRLAGLGHAVEIASRKPGAPDVPVSALPFHRFDYVEDVPDPAWLGGYDAIVFAASNDARHIDGGIAQVQRSSAETDLWKRVNSDAVPAFAAAAKAAGVGTFILIGSYYSQAAPQLLGTNAYVDSRHAADIGTRVLADDRFRVVALNAPYVIGHVPGIVVAGRKLIVDWALGRLPHIGRWAPPGGSNVISTDTLTDAIVGALERGENGKAYLIGDENPTLREYLTLYLQAAGDEGPLEERDERHPLFPPGTVLAGHGAFIFYETDPAEVALLGYRQGDVRRTVQIIVDAYR